MPPRRAKTERMRKTEAPGRSVLLYGFIAPIVSSAGINPCASRLYTKTGRMPRKGRLLNTRCTWERGRIVINHTRVWRTHTQARAHTYTCTSARGNVHKAQLGCSEAICIATIQCVKVCARSLPLIISLLPPLCVCVRAFSIIFLTACVRATSRSGSNSRRRVSSGGRTHS